MRHTKKTGNGSLGPLRWYVTNFIFFNPTLTKQSAPRYPRTIIYIKILTGTRVSPSSLLNLIFSWFGLLAEFSWSLMEITHLKCQTQNSELKFIFTLESYPSQLYMYSCRYVLYVIWLIIYEVIIKIMNSAKFFENN